MKKDELLPGVFLVKEPSGWYRDSRFFLEILGERLPLTEEQAHAMLVKVLPADKVVWSLNRDKEDGFYSSAYPEWSVKPHPADLVAGNIYFRHKHEAEAALRRAIKKRIGELEDKCQLEVVQLEKLASALPKTDS